jgi:hypothetical protein
MKEIIPKTKAVSWYACNIFVSERTLLSLKLGELRQGGKE